MKPLDATGLDELSTLAWALTFATVYRERLKAPPPPGIAKDACLWAQWYEEQGAAASQIAENVANMARRQYPARADELREAPAPALTATSPAEVPAPEQSAEQEGLS